MLPVMHCLVILLGWYAVVETSPLPSTNCPLAWRGEGAAICNSQVCAQDEDCIQNGVRGYCCPTECGGRNCHYVAVKVSLRAECPEPVNWTGVDNKSCPEMQCKANRECNKTGSLGFCCQTSCWGQNCFFVNSTTSPGKSKRSSDSDCESLVDDDCDQDDEDDEVEDHNIDKRQYPYEYEYYYYDYGYHYGGRAVSSPFVCPSNWSGVEGVCKHHHCSNDSQCSSGGRSGLCCPTKCGGHNCYNKDPRPRIVLDCPSNWTGTNNSTCLDQRLCNKSKECTHEGIHGLCCDTTCSGRSCYFTNTSRNPKSRNLCPNPREWHGAEANKCSERSCDVNAMFCQISGQKGYCCRTSCRGMSCYVLQANATSP